MHPLFEQLHASKAYAEYSKLFLDVTGLALRLVPSDFRETESVSLPSAHMNDFCTKMRRMKTAAQQCRKQHECLAMRAQVKLTPQYSTGCPAKLKQTAIPMVLEGQHVATLLTGCVASRKPREEDLMRVEAYLERCGIGKRGRRLQHALARVPVISGKKQRSLSSLLALCAEHLLASLKKEIVWADRDEPPVVRRAKELIRRDPSADHSIIASQVGLSRSQLSRTFKQVTRITVGQFTTLVRLEKAMSLLARPNTKVIYIAHEAGFGSVSQFNRSFKKQNGQSPSQWRSRTRTMAEKRR